MHETTGVFIYIACAWRRGCRFHFSCRRKPSKCASLPAVPASCRCLVSTNSRMAACDGRGLKALKAYRKGAAVCPRPFMETGTPFHLVVPYVPRSCPCPTLSPGRELLDQSWCPMFSNPLPSICMGLLGVFACSQQGREHQRLDGCQPKNIQRTQLPWSGTCTWRNRFELRTRPFPFH